MFAPVCSPDINVSLFPDGGWTGVLLDMIVQYAKIIIIITKNNNFQLLNSLDNQQVFLTEVLRLQLFSSSLCTGLASFQHVIAT